MSRELVALWNQNLKLIWSNRKTGVKELQADSSNCWDILPHAPLDCSTCPVKDALQTGRISEAKVTTTGGESWLLRAYPVKDEREQTAQVLQIGRRIAKPAQLESSLRDSEARYRALVEHLGVGIALISPNMEILALNRKMREWFPDVDIRSNPVCYQVFNHPPGQTVCTDCPTQRALVDGKVHESTTETPTSDGGVRHFRVVASPVLNESDKVTGVIEMVEDVTKFRETEIQREKLRDRLAEYVRLEALEKLAGSVAHDLNNLLTIMTVNVEFLLAEAGEDQRSSHEALSELGEAAQSAARLTNHLLQFSRKKAAQPEVLPLNETLLSFERLVARIMGPDVSVIYNLTPDSIFIRADPTQLEQVILNVCMNARDAMSGHGSLRIETRPRRITEVEPASRALRPSGDFVQLAISDTGCGMDESVQRRVFEPFFTTKKAGHGLGLASVHGIVTQAGGFIELESAPGRGATFRIHFPATSSEEAARQESTATILLVDDEPAVRRVARAALEGRGYKVLEAGGGAEALQVAQTYEGPIHLLVSDVVMPETSGLECYFELRRVRPEIKVLYISGYWSQATSIPGELIDASSFLPKPFSPKTFVAKVRDVLESGS